MMKLILINICDFVMMIYNPIIKFLLPLQLPDFIVYLFLIIFPAIIIILLENIIKKLFKRTRKVLIKILK